MALPRVANFNWDKILAKLHSPDVRKSVLSLRAKSNEILGNTAKFVKAPAAIDFGTYKQKLRFTSSAVDSLETLYKNRKLPTFTATLPAIEAKKRAAVITVIKETVEAAKADLVNLEKQIQDFESVRITDETHTGQLRDRFPQIAKEVEEEINSFNWAKDSR